MSIQFFFLVVWKTMHLRELGDEDKANNRIYLEYKPNHTNKVTAKIRPKSMRAQHRLQRW